MCGLATYLIILIKYLLERLAICLQQVFSCVLSMRAFVMIGVCWATLPPLRCRAVFFQGFTQHGNI